MVGRSRNLTGLLVAVGLAVSIAACSGGSATPSVSPTNSGGAVSSVPAGSGPNARQADVEWVELCKDYPVAPGPATTFTIAVDVGSNGSIDQTFQRTLASGTCQDVWFSDVHGIDTLTITESVPTGYDASSVHTENLHGVLSTKPAVIGNVATGIRSSTEADFGALVVFTNTPPATPRDPPPPSTGTEGCTPGYWKQSQHFDSWPAPFTPTTLFNTVFDNAFPGKTLLQVLENGGGGLDALGRHTVAALLNAASSGVDFGPTPAQVISAFNSVYPGLNYETQKNLFAFANERGCPLN